MSHNRTGVFVAAASAFGYAFTIIFGASLAGDGLSAPVVLSIRFGLSGFVLVALCHFLRRPLLPPPGQRVRVFLLGAVCYAAESALFFAAVVRTSAATAAVIVYFYPVLVTLFDALLRRRPPGQRIVAALCLSVSGTALVAGAGGHFAVQAVGVALALAAAALFAVYLMLGASVIGGADPFAAGAWVSLGAAATCGIAALAGPGYGATAGHWPALLGNGVANVVAFGMMFAALQRLRPTEASVVFTLEAVFAVLLAAAFLHEVLEPIQAVGAACVLGAAIVVLRSQSEPKLIESELAVR